MVTDINNHAVIIYMYGFIARLFETLVRVFSYLQIQYTMFMNDLGIPVYRKFFVGEHVPPPPSFEYIQGGCSVAPIYTDLSEYDFILYKDEATRMTYSSKTDIDMRRKDGAPKISSAKFISMELSIGNAAMPFSLSDAQTYNYYMVGNVIGSSVINYIMRTHYANEYVATFEDPDFVLLNGDYTLQVIDSNVQIVTMTNKQRLCITKDGYNVS